MKSTLVEQYMAIHGQCMTQDRIADMRALVWPSSQEMVDNLDSFVKAFTHVVLTDDYVHDITCMCDITIRFYDYMSDHKSPVQLLDVIDDALSNVTMMHTRLIQLNPHLSDHVHYSHQLWDLFAYMRGDIPGEATKPYRVLLRAFWLDHLVSEKEKLVIQS